MSSTNKTLHYNLPQFIGSDIPTWLGDFNSAMTAIDSGINAAATSASGAATTAAEALTTAAAAQKSANDALNRCPFPVGYGGFFQIDPNGIYKGTTWQQKKDVFILAAGDTYPAGSTGGEAKHKLTIEEMPSHNHVEKIGDRSSTQLVNTLKKRVRGGTEQGGYLEANWSDTGLQEDITTSWVGGYQPHNNMPPYYAMPFWIRTA